MDKSSVQISNAVSSTKPAWADYYVVGIGASAGGLEAIHELFDNIPQDTQFAFVIIQHLSPDYKSLMAELLTKHTQMKVSEVEDGVLMMPNCVYVIPNRKLITLQHGKLRLIEKDSGSGPNLAIDTFFRSLAKEKKEKAIGIILSGTGTDGTRGVEEIKKYGGLVVVQDPATAKFDGMPNSAVASGHTDLILPPEMMPEEILRYVRRNDLVRKLDEDGQIDEKDQPIVEEILQLIKKDTLHDFTFYKRHTLHRRIARRMVQHHIERMDRYLNLLRQNPEEVRQLSKDFLIGVTRFFRDSEAFNIIERNVIPAIIDAKKNQDSLKFWVAACSTGEEAYSLAILVEEYLTRTGKSLNVKIFATDIDQDAIEFASRGQYPENSMRGLSPERIERFFVREGGKYILTQQIRRMVIFAHHNIIKDPPYSKIDLVSCRNMLIYMTPTLQKKVLSVFQFSLNAGGFLFLGASENPGELEGELTEVDKRWRIYKAARPAKSFVFDSYAAPNVSVRREVKRLSDNRPVRGSLTSRVGDLFNEVLMEEFGYVGICVDENFDLLHAMGDYKQFLTLPEKKLHFNLLKMVPRELALALSTSVRRLQKNKLSTTSRRINLREEHRIRTIQLVVKPFLTENDFGQKFILILLREEQVQKPSADEILVHDRDSVHLEEYHSLEQELKEVRENLNAAVEELETSNEELQSSNEELISSNEELQSTNEELQSLNEELHTVNTEHQLKIKELIELNEDLDNYFRSTDIGQIFLDKDLVIRKYTPAVVKQINLIDSDIGRPIHHLSYNLRYERLVDDIREVIASSEPIEREIELSDGRFTLMRVLPYVRLDRRTDGAVVTFVDITTLKNLNNILSGVLNSSLSGIMAFRAIRDKADRIMDFEWILVNEAAARLVKRRSRDLVGKRMLAEMPGNREEGLFDKYIQVMHTGHPLHIEHYYEHDGVHTWFETVAVKMENGLAITFADISKKKEAEQRVLISYQELKKAEETLKELNNELENRVRERTAALSLSEERFRLVSLATNDVLWDWNLVTNELWWNEGFRTLFGYQPDETEGGIESWYNRLHPEDRDRVMEGMQQVLNSGESQWSDEYRFRKHDGSYAYIFGRGYVLHNEYHIPYRMLGSQVDLTSLKQAQEELKETNAHLLKINNDLDNFVYTASHDLKAPVVNLEALFQRLEKQLELKDERTAILLNLMGKTIHKFRNTVTDLTEISKVQKNEQDDVEMVNLPELLEDIQVNIREMFESSSAQIRFDFSECDTIEFSRKNLYSILYNLLSNAIKYRSPERVPIIFVVTRRSDGYVLLQVQDNGLGIEKQYLTRLFGMFKRFHTHVDGTGVGLYIVKRIVENAGGHIEAESEVGKGTTFNVYFRIQEKQPNAEAAG